MAGTDSSKDEALDPGPVIILVEPQMGENIGAAARAMLNCGLTELRLVRPRDGWPNLNAIASSAGADSVVEAAKVYRNTEEAVADLQVVYATTARRRDMVKPVYRPDAAIAEMRRDKAANRQVGVLFGRERSGLSNTDVSQAQAIITAPLNPAYSSLNLGQSVLLIAWEWLKSSDDTIPVELPMADSFPAPQASTEALMNHLDVELQAAKFYRSSEQRPAALQHLRNIFARAAMTEQETRMLRGVVSRMAALRRKVTGE
ncbi:MAG: RNA methyltransferase [Alphaproteobacteria bacterium]